MPDFSDYYDEETGEWGCPICGITGFGDLPDLCGEEECPFREENRTKNSC
jgi:rubredoxin